MKEGTQRLMKSHMPQEQWTIMDSFIFIIPCSWVITNTLKSVHWCLSLVLKNSQKFSLQYCFSLSFPCIYQSGFSRETQSIGCVCARRGKGKGVERETDLF